MLFLACFSYSAVAGTRYSPPPVTPSYSTGRYAPYKQAQIQQEQSLQRSINVSKPDPIQRNCQPKAVPCK
jgi:hypothetical protein